MNVVKNWLFVSYDSRAYGLFRIFFYSLVFLYFHFYDNLSFGNWFTADFVQYYEPVSFFKIFSFENLKFLTTIDLYFIWKISLLFCVFGFLFPLSSWISFLGLLIMAGIPLNFGKIHHSHHLVVVVLGFQAMNLSAGGYSVDSQIFSKINQRQSFTKWALQLSRLYMAIIYFSAGFQKLRNTGLDWIFSDNLQTQIMIRPTVTSLGLWVVQYKWLCQLMALTTVIAQLSAPLALFESKARYLIVITLFSMHIGTYLMMGADGFFFLYNLCFVVWIPWEKIQPSLERFVASLKTRIFYQNA